MYKKEREDGANDRSPGAARRAVPEAGITEVCVVVGLLSWKDEKHLWRDGGSGNRSVELKLCSSVAMTPACHETCDQPQSYESQGLSRSFLAIISSWDCCSFRIVQPRDSSSRVSQYLHSPVVAHFISQDTSAVEEAGPYNAVSGG